MSKKDKAQEQQQEQPKALTLADMLKDIEGVTVSDDKRLRVTATDVETLNARTEAVVQKLGEFGDVRVSPKYGDAVVTGCVWYDLVATPKK